MTNENEMKMKPKRDNILGISWKQRSWKVGNLNLIDQF